MDAASVTTFCHIRELSFVEQTVQGGVKGAWFETRRHERKFFPEAEIAGLAQQIHSHPLPRIGGFSRTS
jgi:hypothetical protein